MTVPIFILMELAQVTNAYLIHACINLWLFVWTAIYIYPGCSLCIGDIKNTDCLACEDTSLYREVTNIRVFASPCVTRCGNKFES